MHTVIRSLVLLATFIATMLSLPCTLAGQDPETARPVVEVDLVPFSHLDFFWGGTREECLARGNQIIAKAVVLARRYPEFRFLIEDNDFVANYVESHAGTPEVEDLKKLVTEGRIEISPKWAAIFQNLPNGELHVRNFVYGKRYAREVFHVDPQVAHLGDLPGYTPQFPQIAVKSGVPFAVMTRMGPNDKSLFYWKSPDGSKVLTWFTLSHYGWGSRLGLHRDLDQQREQEIRTSVNEVVRTFQGPIFMSWGSDLWAPTEKLVENVATLNKDLTGLRFRMTTPTEFFHRIERTADVPEESGEIPSSWPNVVSSLAHMWPLAVPATNTLLAAETFAAISYAAGYSGYPGEKFEFLWKKLIESMDHNHDGQGGTIGDDRKIQYSQLAIMEGGEILRDRLRDIAERVEFAVPDSHAIVVFNSMGWTRDDPVTAHVSLYGPVAPRDIAGYKQAMRLLDEKGNAVPYHLIQYSENISRAVVITFVARDIPPLGYRTYYLTPGSGPADTGSASAVTLDDENDRREPRRPLGNDIMENRFYRVSVDKATGRVTVFDKDLGRDVVKDAEVVGVEERGGNYIGIEPLSGRTLFTSIDRVSLEENNSVRTVMKLEGRIADIPVVQRWTLYAGLKQVDLENTVQWKGPRFIRVQQLFPYEHPGAAIHYGIPFGENAATNIMAKTGPRVRDEITRESWERARQIQDWIFAGTPEWGLTVASDHQLMKLDDGMLRAEMLRGTRFVSVKVVRGDEVTSMFYPPDRTYSFKYSLSSGKGGWKEARSFQQGANLNNPLVPVSVVDDVSRKSLPPVHSFCSLDAGNVVVSALKKSDTGDALILRFYELEGTPAVTGLEFLGQKVLTREVDLLEENESRNEERQMSVKPYEIKTVKLRVAR